jgi:excisionase family DNA binding protein
MTGPRRWISVREAAEYLGIAVKSAYDMAAVGKLPAAHVGRLVRIDLRVLEADLEAQIQGQPAAARGKGGR